MKNVEINLLPKQTVAWNLLNDATTTEVLFGGSAGSAKSFLGCLWVTNQCLTYPGVRYLIGRTRLTALRLTTIKTLLDLYKLMGFVKDEHYNYNLQSNTITFNNGSEIIFKDLEYYPSDPEYDSLGSLELTGVFVDEAQMLTEMCYTVLKSRIRYKLNEYKLGPKILLTCNPHQGWLKRTFYTPFSKGELPSHMEFVQATAYDNPYLPPSYVQTLERLPEQQRQRLLLGSWVYTEDINTMFYYDRISDSFHLNPTPNTGEYHMALDVARFGSDKAILIVARGTTITEINIYEKLDLVKLSEKVRERMIWYKVPPSRLITDEDGVGGGIVDMLRCKGFVNNSSPLNKENYTNLKSQCYYLLAKKFTDGEISINIDKPELMDVITQELLVVKMKDVDKDGKMAIIPKEQMKMILGHSPDYADAIMMLMYFFIKKRSSGVYSLSTIKR